MPHKKHLEISPELHTELKILAAKNQKALTTIVEEKLWELFNDTAKTESRKTTGKEKAKNKTRET
jgi:hypothetical protein